jgi:hypothetical protein
MSVPFTQYLLPHGRATPVMVDRPPEIEALALRFIARGGLYECEMLTTGEVSFTAVFDIDGEQQDIAIEVCANGPPVLAAVDSVVRKSVAMIGVDARMEVRDE